MEKQQSWTPNHEREQEKQGSSLSLSHQAITSDEDDVIAEEMVSCLQDKVLLAMLRNKTCYVSVQQSCTVLGLNPRGQLQGIVNLLKSWHTEFHEYINTCSIRSPLQRFSLST